MSVHLSNYLSLSLGEIGCTSAIEERNQIKGSAQLLRGTLASTSVSFYTETVNLQLGRGGWTATGQTCKISKRPKTYHNPPS